MTRMGALPCVFLIVRPMIKYTMCCNDGTILSKGGIRYVRSKIRDGL